MKIYKKKTKAIQGLQNVGLGVVHGDDCWLDRGLRQAADWGQEESRELRGQGLKHGDGLEADLGRVLLGVGT